MINVLVVDNNPGDYRLLKESLQEYSHFEIKHSENLKSALINIDKTKFDIILSDLNLSDSKGIETFNTLFNANRDIPLVILTELTDKNLAIDAIQKGAQDYLLKGEITAKLLSHAILYAIERKKYILKIEKSSCELLKKETRFLKIIHKDINDKVTIDDRQQLIQAQKLESIGNLAGGVAQVFNNILTVIKSYCEILEIKTCDNKDIQNYISQIDYAADKASSLTGQLLAFSRKQFLLMQPVDLNDLINNIKEMLIKLSGNDIFVFLDLQTNLSLIDADPHQINQILIKLCLNAKSAMPSGGKLYIRTKNKGNGVELSVEDTGEGIEEEFLEKIFDPFFTTKEQGQGAGLGLSVIYGIVKQHKADISVISKKNQGSHFVLKFKRSENINEIISNISNFENNADGKKNILIVEDDENIREILTINLEENNCTIFPAGSVEDALVIFKTHIDEINIIISDVVLSDGSGLDFVEELIILKENLLIIVTSGYTDDKLHLKSIVKRGFHFIQKPYKMTDILQIIGGNYQHGSRIYE